jgi:hypothetical protein
MTFSGTRDLLHTRFDELEAIGTSEVIVGTGGAEVERELRPFAEVAGL